MKDSDKQKILEVESAAWRSISTYHSVAMANPVERININLLLDKITEQKKQIDKLIDSMED